MPGGKQSAGVQRSRGCEGVSNGSHLPVGMDLWGSQRGIRERSKLDQALVATRGSKPVFNLSIFVVHSHRLLLPNCRCCFICSRTTMTLVVDDGSLLRRNLDHYATKGLARLAFCRSCLRTRPTTQQTVLHLENTTQRGEETHDEKCRQCR